MKNHRFLLTEKDDTMKEFCLLDEPWIRVLWADLSIKEISLKDSLLSSYEYMRLIGEVFPGASGGNPFIHSLPAAVAQFSSAQAG